MKKKPAKIKRIQTKVLIILNKSQSNESRILVKLHKKWLREKVNKLLREAKDREAFDLIVSHAEVDRFIPPGTKLTERPAITFVEDML